MAQNGIRSKFMSYYSRYQLFDNSLEFGQVTSLNMIISDQALLSRKIIGTVCLRRTIPIVLPFFPVDVRFVELVLGLFNALRAADCDDIERYDRIGKAQDRAHVVNAVLQRIHT